MKTAKIPAASVLENYSSVREFMERTSPAGEDAPPPLPAALMCHIFLLSSVLERVANRECERCGMTLSQWMALGCIGNEGKVGITHSELCHRLMLSKAPVTGIVDRMERDGFARRVADENDRRVSRIIIKPKGEKTWRQVRDVLRDHAIDHCSAMNQSEQETLLGLLARMLDKVSKSDPTIPLGSAAQDKLAALKKEVHAQN